MINCIRDTASCTFTIFVSIFAASGGALFAAIYSQLALGLDPCVLCLYQRVPYIAAMLLALLGLAMRTNAKIVNGILALCSFAFLINAGIALYHSGIERKWWTAGVEGCAVPDFSSEPNLLEKLLTTPAAHCDKIAWSDPLLGLSMANYNVFYSLLLWAGCILALACLLCPQDTSRPHQKP